MINRHLYRGYEILVDTQNGGWFVKLGADVLCSQPNTDKAYEFVDNHILANNKLPIDRRNEDLGS